MAGGNFFRLLKSGCRGEALQRGPRERLQRALVIYLVIAWRILPGVTWGRNCPELLCEVVFDTQAWQAAWIVARCRPLPASVAFSDAKATVIPAPKPWGKGCNESGNWLSPSRPEKRRMLGKV